MNEFEDIQRLIRLKRFEQPEEGFTENFLQQFHQRQRAEMLRQSSVELLLERVTTWWDHLMVPKWSLATAALGVCAVSTWMVVSRPAGTSGPAVTAATPAAGEKPFVPKLDLSDLPMARMAEQDKATLNELLLRNHLEVRPILDSQVSPAPSQLPANAQDKPTLQNAKPAVQSGTDGLLGK